MTDLHIIMITDPVANSSVTCTYLTRLHTHDSANAIFRLLTPSEFMILQKPQHCDHQVNQQ